MTTEEKNALAVMLFRQLSEERQIKLIEYLKELQKPQGDSKSL